MAQDNGYVHGLTIVHTGNGKGKTTAALGLSIRAWGEDLKVLILQFIKGGWKYGELKALEKFAPDITIKQCGEGFTRRNNKDIKKHQESAMKALDKAKEEMMNNHWDMIILDEINYAVDFNLIPVEKVLDLIENKPDKLHLVLTGRNAKEEIIAKANLVTEMKEIKHPFKEGIKAQKGIEF